MDFKYDILKHPNVKLDSGSEVSRPIFTASRHGLSQPLCLTATFQRRAVTPEAVSTSYELLVR